MNVYIIPTAKTIYPFGDRIEDVLIANQTLRDLQRKNIRKMKGTPRVVNSLDDIHDPEPHIIMYDNMYITAKALHLIKQTGKKIRRSFKVGVSNPHYSRFYLWHVHPGGEGPAGVDIFYVAAQGTISHDLLPLAFESRHFGWEKMPAHMEVHGRAFNYPLTDTGIIPVNNWVNLWQANIHELMRHAYELEYTRRWRQIIPLILARGSVYKASMYMNTIGKNSRIHPTAVVEASIIGDNVQIGAHAVVRLSIIGDNVYISDQALVRGCVLGDGAYIANNNNLAFDVVYPLAFLISGPYQFSIFGSECAVMHCIDCDTRLDKHTIRAFIDENEKVETNQIYLGSCFGHRVRIGAGTISVPGMAYRNDLWINPSPAITMNKVNESVTPRENTFLVNGEIISKRDMKQHLLTSSRRK
jgi:carbonic anhydrase/acetyltransferase-like protein (isoleucine patch superfamily)